MICIDLIINTNQKDKRIAKLNIIKVPVLAVIRASDKLRCSGVLTRDSFNRTTSESNDKDNAHSKGNVRNDVRSHR